jgi:uncharacterized protein YpuA (DUF1002 family)
MPLWDRGQRGHQRMKVSIWFLYVLVIAVLILSILAFRSPISQQVEEPTVSPTLWVSQAEETNKEVEQNLTPAPEETLVRPEEIGYTDEIILWSAILVLIPLVATLREYLLKKER